MKIVKYKVEVVALAERRIYDGSEIEIEGKVYQITGFDEWNDNGYNETKFFIDGKPLQEFYGVDDIRTDDLYDTIIGM